MKYISPALFPVEIVYILADFTESLSKYSINQS